MANETEQKKQMKNQNGRSVLVISNQNIDDAAKIGQTTSDILGYLTTGVKVIDKNNFYWEVLHSTNPPTWGVERLKTAKNIKMYPYNPETKGVFQGNKYVSVTNVGTVAKEVDKVASKLSLASDAAEIVLAIRTKDEKALAEKASTMAISKGTETAGLAVAGKCTNFSMKRLDPKRIAIAGAACYAASYYGGQYVGEKVGEKVGETSTAVNAARAVIEAIDIIDEKERKAEEKRRAEEIKKDPMLEWHILGAD